MKAEFYEWLDENKKVLNARSRRMRKDDQQTSLSEHEPGVKELMEGLRNGKEKDIQDTYTKAVR